MMANLSYRRELEVRGECDVLIAGGGPAGIAAALAAARHGASVRLVDAHTCLGGMGTAGMVPVFMPFDDGVNFLAGGIGREIHDRLKEAGGTCGTRFVNIKAEALKRLYDSMLAEAGVDFTFHTQVVDAGVEDGRVKHVVCAAKSGLHALRARMFVDCTGDGDLAAFAGAPYEKGDASGHMMPATLCSLWDRINWTAVRENWIEVENDCELGTAIKDGVLTVPDRHLPGMWQTGTQAGGGNIGHAFDLDGTDERSLTRGFVHGRKILPEYETYYRKYLKRGFDDVELMATAPLMGVRETRRIMGDYVLCVDDFRKLSNFDDEIGRFNYWIDIHIAKPDRESYDEHVKLRKTARLKKGESYGIPYRVLTPRGLKNVLTAGRCVSTDQSLQASIRVMPGCFITGQAAGVAAAMAAAGACDTRAVPVAELQTKLVAMGAYLPNRQQGAKS